MNGVSAITLKPPGASKNLEQQESFLLFCGGFWLLQTSQRRRAAAAAAAAVMASSSSAKEENGLKSMRRRSKQEEEKRRKKKKYTLKELKGLGRDLLSSRAHINNLPILLNFISSEFPSHHVLESLLSLQSFFTPLLPNLPPSSSSSSSTKKKLHKKDKDGEDDDDEAEVIYRIWLRSKFDELVRLLIDLVLAPEPDQTLREVALDAIMELVKMANGGGFHSAIFYRLLVRIVHAGTQVEFLLDLLSSKYFKYIDVRYFTYITLKKLATTLEKPKDFSGKLTETADRDDESGPESSMELCIRNIHYILSHLPPLEDPKENSDYEMWSGSEFMSKEGESKGLSGKVEDKQLKSGKHNNVLSAATIAKKMKLKFTNAWMSFLKLPLPLDVYKEVLVTLHQAVIPHLSNPKLLSDFLTRSYNVGGVISVMALSSLFILMTQHGLEYPNFYEKLYALLIPSIFMAKHRARFFELLDSCLKSPLLPAYLAAAFAKKLSRLALAVPPSGGLVIIALIHNLLRRHPSINCLVHQDGRETSDGNSEADVTNGESSNETHRDISTSKLGIDHFNDDESNPAKANALRSSLWEIDTLRHHYCPPVSRFVLSLENDLTARAKTTEFAIKDFSSGSYATVFGDEIRRRVKQVPLAFYKAIPTCLFSRSEFAGWTFEHEKSKESNSTNVFLDVAKENDESPAKRQRVECCS